MANKTETPRGMKDSSPNVPADKFMTRKTNTTVPSQGGKNQFQGAPMQSGSTGNQPKYPPMGSQKKPALTPDGPGVDLSNESKYQPSKRDKVWPVKFLGDQPQGSTAVMPTYGATDDDNSGSDYHEPHRKTSGRWGNFAKRDQAISDLRNTNKEGVVVRHWTGGKLNSPEQKTMNIGMTAYNGRPIPETYHPGTSYGPPHENPTADGINYRNMKPQKESKISTDRNIDKTKPFFNSGDKNPR